MKCSVWFRKSDYLDAIVNDVADAAEDMTNHPMYLILNLARVLGYLTEHKVFSKKEGGLWGLENLPEEFHPLIRSALDEYANGTEVDYDPVLAGRYAAEMLRRIADGQKNTGEKLPGEDPVIP